MAGADSVEVRARAIRARIVRMAHAGKTPHVASALSCADVVAALYFGVLRIDPAVPEDEGRDRSHPQQRARVHGAVCGAGRARILSRGSAR